MTDWIVIGLRALAFIAALQAAGVPMFLCLFGDDLRAAGTSIRRLGQRAGAAGLLLTVAYQLATPARLTGDLSGVLDGSMQALMIESDAGTATGVRVLGLMMIALALLARRRFATTAALAGSVLVAVSFAFMGHTASADQRWLLASLLILHLFFVAFWFGALQPLVLASRHEPPALSGRIVEQFSKLAIWLVPGLFVAGLAMSVMLLRGASSLLTAYGWSLLAKVSGFTVLMLLAALNKWQLGPRLVHGELGVAAAFRRSLQAEWVLIAAVLTITAVMTSLFSPVH